MIWLMSATLSVSMVLGPPLACTPVYRLLSSWNLFASATVPEKEGPPASRMDASSFASSSPRLAAHCLSPSMNCRYEILRADGLVLTLAKMRSMSVLVHFLFTTPQSLANLAHTRPSISAAPAVNLENTS